MRIALLEDDRYQADVMQVWLQAVGHECRTYPTGKAFKDGVRCGECDLVILDWVLPDTDGIEVLGWIRANCDWHIPVIFVTRMDREEDVVMAMEFLFEQALQGLAPTSAREAAAHAAGK